MLHFALESALLAREPDVRALVVGVMNRGGRLQFNVNARRNPALVASLVEWLEARPNVSAITQHNASNAPLLDRLRQHRPNHGYLADASGGRGIEPADWGAPQAPQWGYAGGLGPDNLAVHLPRIASAAGGQPFWIDMEGRLRDGQDRFDVDAARRCLEIVGQVMSAPGPLSSPQHIDGPLGYRLGKHASPAQGADSASSTIYGDVGVGRTALPDDNVPAQTAWFADETASYKA